MVCNTCGGGRGLCRGALQLCHVRAFLACAHGSHMLCASGVHSGLDTNLTVVADNAHVNRWLAQITYPLTTSLGVDGALCMDARRFGSVVELYWLLHAQYIFAMTAPLRCDRTRNGDVVESLTILWLALSRVLEMLAQILDETRGCESRFTSISESQAAWD